MPSAWIVHVFNHDRTTLTSEEQASICAKLGEEPPLVTAVRTISGVAKHEAAETLKRCVFFAFTDEASAHSFRIRMIRMGKYTEMTEEV
jgi:hypothetical protein